MPLPRAGFLFPGVRPTLEAFLTDLRTEEANERLLLLAVAATRDEKSQRFQEKRARNEAKTVRVAMPLGNALLF